MISDANRKRSTEVNRFTIDRGRGAKGGGGGVGVGEGVENAVDQLI